MLQAIILLLPNRDQAGAVITACRLLPCILLRGSLHNGSTDWHTKAAAQHWSWAGVYSDRLCSRSNQYQTAALYREHWEQIKSKPWEGNPCPWRLFMSEALLNAEWNNAVCLKQGPGVSSYKSWRGNCGLREDLWPVKIRLSKILPVQPFWVLQQADVSKYQMVEIILTFRKTFTTHYIEVEVHGHYVKSSTTKTYGLHHGTSHLHHFIHSPYTSLGCGWFSLLIQPPLVEKSVCPFCFMQRTVPHSNS